MSVVFNLGNGNWAGRYTDLVSYKVVNGNYIVNELNFTRTTTGTFVNQDGFIEEQEIRVPRVDYLNNSNGTLLIEPTRTNKSNNSEDWTVSGYVKNNVTVTANQTTSPDGTQNADQLDFGSGTAFFYENVTTITAASTYSVFVKYIDYQYIQIIGTGDVNHYANFDIQNGIVGNTGSASTASIEDYGNGWYRCIINYNSGTFAGGARVYKTTSLTANWANTGGGGGDAGSFYFWGNQMETHTGRSTLTSYIPTSGTTVTRQLDYFNGNIEEVTTQGTIFIDFQEIGQGGGSYRFTNTSNTTSYGFYFYNDGMDVYNNSAFIVDRTTLEPNNSKVAVSWNGTNVKVFINGNNRTKSGAVASLINTEKISFNDPNDIGNFNEIKVYDTELTDEELITLTT